MADPYCFHLHYNTPDVAGAAERLAAVSLPCSRRFGSVHGEGVSLAPEDPEPAGFRFKLQVHERDAVNLTLAPGRAPHFDHLGVVVDDLEAVLERATARDWSVRRSERRTFAMTPWGFRVELHGRGSVAFDETDNGLRIDSVRLRVPEPDAVRDGLFEVVGQIPGLAVEAGDGPWTPTFTLTDGTETTTVEVTALLDESSDRAETRN